MIKSGHCEYFAASPRFAAQKRLQSRIVEKHSPSCLSEVYAYDKLALAFLEEFSKPVVQKARPNKLDHRGGIH